MPVRRPRLRVKRSFSAASSVSSVGYRKTKSTLTHGATRSEKVWTREVLKMPVGWHETAESVVSRLSSTVTGALTSPLRSVRGRHAGTVPSSVYAILEPTDGVSVAPTHPRYSVPGRSPLTVSVGGEAVGPPGGTTAVVSGAGALVGGAGPGVVVTGGT
eukprot:1945570-Rhodomonas_salina.2